MFVIHQIGLIVSCNFVQQTPVCSSLTIMLHFVFLTCISTQPMCFRDGKAHCESLLGRTSDKYLFQMHTALGPPGGTWDACCMEGPGDRLFLASVTRKHVFLEGDCWVVKIGKETYRFPALCDLSCALKRLVINNSLRSCGIHYLHF